MTQDEIRANVGRSCTIDWRGDFYFDHSDMLPGYLGDRFKTVEIVKLTRGGLAYVKRDDGRLLTIPPGNLRLADGNQ